MPEVASRPRVVLLGDTNVDVILDIDHLPRAGADALAHGQNAGAGGSATNTTIMLQRLGEAGTLVSCVGRDHWADFALAELKAEGIDVGSVVRHESEPTSLNVIVVTPDGERTMFAYRGASAWLMPEALENVIGPETQVLHLSGYALLTDPQREAALTAVRVARAANVPVCLDVPVPAAESAADEIRAMLSELAVIVVGLPEARLITGLDDAGEAINALLEGGVGMVALKLGADGSMIATRDQQILIPPHEVVGVDTTGAGDAFAAGVVAAMCAGASPGVLGALANACGAAAITRRGSGRALPQIDDVRALLDAHVVRFVGTMDEDYARAASSWLSVNIHPSR